MSQSADVYEEPLTMPRSKRYESLSSGFGFELLCIFVGFLGLALSFPYWGHWFVSIDRIVFGMCLGLGLLKTVSRSPRVESAKRSKSRISLAVVGIAALVLVSSWFASMPPLGLVAMGLAIQSWYSIRWSSRPAWISWLVGLACMTPLGIDLLETFGGFRFLEFLSIGLTTALSDLLGIVNLPDVHGGNRVVYALGVAERFKSQGSMDGILSLVGVAFLICVLRQRSRLVTSLTILTSIALWVSLCGCTWAGLAWMSSRTGTWHEWTVFISILNLVMGVLLLVCLDQFCSAFFVGIPPELVSVDFPQATLAWNWFCNPANNSVGQPISEANMSASSSAGLPWFRRPQIFILSLLDFGQGWNDSRPWWRILCFSPVFLIGLAIFAVFGFHHYSLLSSRGEYSSTEGEQRVSTRQLELVEWRGREEELTKSIDADSPPMVNTKATSLHAVTLYELELLCKRVLNHERDNARTHYRLGLIYSLTNRAELAEMEMLDLARWSYGKFPQANAWIARERIISQAHGKAISERDLLVDLRLASEYPDFDQRLRKVFRELQDSLADRSNLVELAERAMVPPQSEAPTDPEALPEPLNHSQQ